MKSSIKVKMFIGICLFTILLTAFGIFLNGQFFDDFYMYKKKNQMINQAEDFVQGYKANNNDIQLQLEIVASEIGGNAYLIDVKTGDVYSTAMNNMMGGMMGKGMGMGMMISKNSIIKTMEEGIYFEKKVHHRLMSEYLSMGYVLETGNIIILEMPFEAVTASATIAIQFALITALFSLITGGALAYIFAGRFTKPIIQLNHMAKDMSELKFGGKFYYNKKDELGLLGESINHMSSQLSETIEELNVANMQLKEDIDLKERIDDMRKEFISNVSHELKTPISLIEGYAEGLKDNVMDNEEDKAYYCDVIIEESERMHQLVEDLLNLSQLQAKGYELNLTKFDLSALLDEILSKYSPVFKEKQIQVNVVKEDIVMITGDRRRLGQVIMNYINNALNHMNSKKQLRVSIESDVTINKTCLKVFNSGEQIPEVDVEKIWNSFYKVDKARSSGSGSGLGLSIVKNIIDLHEGGFGVENKEDGVTFWFTI